jgi:hypothetical protein
MSYSQHSSVKNVFLTSAEATFYDAVLAAEVSYQNADKSTPANAKTADINRHRAIAQAAAVSGLGHLGGPSRSALLHLTGAAV